MDNKYLEVYKQLSNNDKKAFREALAAGDLVTVGAYCRSFKPLEAPIISEDSRRGVGRPDMGLTIEGIEAARAARLQCNSLNNSNDVIEYTPGDIVPASSLEDFKKEYETIIDDVCCDFYNSHDDLVKKSPFIWVNSLLYELKKHLPLINVKDAARVGVAWDLFSGLMFKVGLFPTMEAFTNLTGVYKQQLFRELTPAHIELKTRIYNDCRNNMVNQVSYNPMTQVNKMFLLKSVYGFKESGGGDLVQDDKKSLNVDDIPLFLPGDISGSDI